MGRGAYSVFAGLLACGCGANNGNQADATTASASATATDTTTSTDSASASTVTSATTTATTGTDDGPKLDVGQRLDIDPCQAGDWELEFSHIWIANSPQGTVSKIDTETAMELGRYASGPEANPDPSRTSVNLYGDAAVLNRGGSVIKVAAREGDCDDRNNNNTIETSQGALDVLAWWDDECVLWHHDLPYQAPMFTTPDGPRAIAWDAGEFGGVDCKPINEKLWVGWLDVDTDVAHVRRIVGDTGLTDVEVDVPNWNDPSSWGIYGGAVDGDGNFWGLGKRNTSLVFVDAETLDVQRYFNPDTFEHYGIALDAEGTPWVAAVDGTLWRFDRQSELYENKGDHAVEFRGIAVDADGQAWMASNNPCSVIQYDIMNEMTVGPVLDYGCGEAVGVSVDALGFVWLVNSDEDNAYKIDPMTHIVDIEVTGLDHPYTYSDMTGSGLKLVANPPG